MTNNNPTLKRTVIELDTRTGDLAGLPVELLEDLNISKTSRLHKKGQILFYEDNRSFGLYYLVSGKVKLYKFTPEGKIYITRIVSAGELLGCQAFFSNEAYCVSAEVIEDAQVCFIEREAVKEMMAQDPGFSLRLLDKLGQELRDAENKAIDIAYKSVPERMAELLMELKQNFGKALADGQIKLDISLSREELASMLGTTVETTVRTLTRFKQLNLIGSDKKSILLKDVKRLTQLIPA
ncbi:MAG: Crp/Fnr family transcriptional regulator [Candidatus Sericytochromatia bacterium]